MSNRFLFIVGNKFHEFAQGKDVLTIDQLKAMLCLPKSVLGVNNKLLLGQGVQENDLTELLEDFDKNTRSKESFDIEDLKLILDRADSAYSHKRTKHNTIIGIPRRKSENTFEIAINIDERCELMGDHQTGQHIQGMLIVEAFRQSFLAVTDMYFPFGHEQNNYFVINVMNTAFQNFLFPLPAHITYQILEQDVTSHRARFRTSMVAMQDGVSCATAEISFTVYSSKVISDKESKMADLALEKALKRESYHEKPLAIAAV